MVVDTAYYDTLEVPPTATEVEIKKAYRKLAIRLHPDKNPGDETAHAKFQAIGEAYQVLSEPQLRAAYDKYGKDSAKPDSGFEDPSEFFSMVFGGEAFADWIGEISLMKDLTHTMDVYGKEAEEEVAAANIDPTSGAKPVSGASTTPSPAATSTSTSTDRKSSATPSTTPSTATAPPPYTSTPTASTIDPTSGAIPIPATTTETTPLANPYAQDRPKGLPTRLALTADSAELSSREATAGVSVEEQRLREKERKNKITREQREELRAYELERQRIRDERVKDLSSKLVSRISVWTETDKGDDVTKAFREKIRLEVENLKMESFGLEILHAVGATYLSKAQAVLKSQKMFGLPGVWSRLKDKGQMAKDTWGTISTAIDAQMSMEEMAKAEEAGGDAWTDERRAELEKRVTGKILAAAWRGSKFEIQSVLREVCDVVLEDPKVSKSKKLERARAMVVVGEMLRDARRDEDEEGDFLVFEQLMAEAAVKRDKKEEKRKEKEKEKSSKGEKEKVKMDKEKEKSRASMS